MKAYLCLVFALLTSSLLAVDLTTRIWTDQKGRKVEATFYGIDGEFVTLQTADGRMFKVPFQNLIEADQKVALSLPKIPVSVPTSASVAQAAGKMDAIINKMLLKKSLKPNPPSSDEQFVRRAYLDITGRIPNFDEVSGFIDDTSPTKRAKLIDQLLDSPGRTSHLYNYFADMFRVRDPDNGGFVNAQPYINWIKDQITKNRPYNEMVYEMLSATGKPAQEGNGATGYLLRDTGMLLDNLANTFSIFLGTDVACAQCHDHPFSDWTQMQFYQLAAFFGSTVTNMNDAQLKNGDPKERIMAELTKLNAEQAKKVEGMVNGIIDANRLEVRDTKENRLRLPMDYKYKDGKGGDPVKPKFITWSKTDRSSEAYRENKTKKQEKQREAFAGWLTHPTNPRFGVTIANRMWRLAFGAGVAEPVRNVDDPKNASNPELLDHLGKEMVRLKFDLREFQRILFNTQAWQREATREAVPMGAPYYFQGPLVRRMTAEQAWDSFMTLVLGEPDKYRNTDKGLLQRVIDIDLDKTDGKVMAQKIEAYQRGQKAKADMMGGSLAAAGGDDMMMNAKVVSYGGMKLMRASELEQPAPEGHFLREFGQSNRELIDGGMKSGSQPQVLMLMNGPTQEMLTSKDSLIFRTMFKQDLPKKQIEAMYLSVLARKPSPEEKTKALAELQASGELEGAQNIVWALLNGMEFMFVQ
jgi:hypothetical protein